MVAPLVAGAAPMIAGGGGAALGLGALGAVTDIVGGIFGQGAHDKSRKAFEAQLRARREGPEGQALRSIFQKQIADLETLPGELKRIREGRLSTAASERMRRFRRNLAASGATGASSVGMIGERGISEGIERQRRESELAERGAISDIRSRTAQLGRGLLDSFYASPGQSVAGAESQRAYYNPLSAVKAGLGGYLTGQTMGGGGGGIYNQPGPPSIGTPFAGQTATLQQPQGQGIFGGGDIGIQRLNPPPIGIAPAAARTAQATNYLNNR